jgi:hypothetical protein
VFVKYTDIFVDSPVENVQHMVNQVFQANKFNIEWKDQHSGTAKRGSKGMNFAFGGFAQYYEIEFKIQSMPDDTVAVRLVKSTTGLMGGALGAHKVKKQYQQVVDMLSDFFKSQGMYKGKK